MLFTTTTTTVLVALLGALSISAIDAGRVQSLVVRHGKLLANRQTLDSSIIPLACTSQCTTALSIYNACTDVGTGNTTDSATSTCLSVCQPDTFSGFVGCFNCAVQNIPGIDQTVYTTATSAVSFIQQACAAAGQTVTGGSSLIPFASLTSNSSSATDSVSATSSATSPVSTTSGSVSATSTSASGAASSKPSGSSVSSSASASSSSAATTSKASGADRVILSFTSGPIFALLSAIGLGVALVL